MPVASEIVQAIARRLADRVGLELPAWVIEARVAARLDALGVSAQRYIELLDARGSELDELVEAVRVGETRLFRHRAQIAALRDDIAPALRAANKRNIRVWSAGCAGGEEPYTLAIVLARALPGVAIQITATDVSADALAVAQAATYRTNALADVPASYHDAFVTAGPDRVRVRPELAALVRFERANLVDGTAPKGCELVWCRNVLIYFTPDARRRAIERLVAATAPGGFIFVGYSESLRDISAVEAVRTGDAIYYVKRRAAASTPTPATGVPRTTGDSGAWARSALTPPPIKIPAAAPTSDVLSLRGEPSARHVTAELTARLAIAGLRELIVDLDGADLLPDDLVLVLRRARAAAEAAHVALVLRATRPGARRWLARHGLEEGA